MNPVPIWCRHDGVSEAMASIVKRGKKYTAVYYAPDEKGKITQRWRATGETDWRKATRVAVELEEKAKESVTEGSRLSPPPPDNAENPQ